MRPRLAPEWRMPIGIPLPRSLILGGPGPVNQHTPQAPSLPLSIMSISTPNPTPTISPTPTPSPSALSLASLNWAFQPVSNVTTCEGVLLQWMIFNSPSDLNAIISSISSPVPVEISMEISAFGSSNVTSSSTYQNTADVVLGERSGLPWFANVTEGLYDVTGIIRAVSNGQGGSSASNSASPSIETAFSVHKGDDTSCLSSDSSASDSQIGAQSPQQPASHSSSNAGAIAGGVIGGILGLALLTAGLLFFFRRRQQQRRRRRGSSSGDGVDGYGGYKGWNGLSSVGSINSPGAVLAKDDVFEKRPSISTLPPYYPAHPPTEPFSHMLVQEPGSPPGSPASVELAHLPLRRPTVGTVGTTTSRRSMSGTTTHTLNRSTSDPFATPIPGTPRAGSEIGHNGAGSRSGSGSEVDFDGGEGYDSRSDSSSTKQQAASIALYNSSLTPASASAKRASHHSRKPVPAYDDLNLTSEEKEALERSGPRHSHRRPSAGAREEDDDVSQKSLSPLSVQSPLSSLPHGNTNAQVDDKANSAATQAEDPTDHEHALALFKNLRSKSSGHMKGEAYVHYLIPDPPLQN